jgi:RimJ/RimL family protein N-acetyltransferase
MIKGNTVGLRALEKSDLELLKEWRNISSFRKNFREVRELNLFNQEKWFERTSSSPNDFMHMIIRLDDETPLGACGLLYTNWINRAADFSFYIGHKELYIDQLGYAEEAASLLLDYGFSNLNLNKIWMEIYEFDTKKIEFFRDKFKFLEDGCLRENCFEDGRYWNSYLISLLRKDYKKHV